ncbi:MAG: hypothetical protein ABFQ65_04010 [Nanoarchaeota archaeon]
MGFIRGSLFIIVSVLLLLSLFSTGFFYMVSLSLDYDVVKEELVSSADRAVREIGVYDEFVISFPLMQEGCLELSTYTFNMEYGVFEISCEVIDLGIDEAYYYSLEEFVMGGYYNDYDCSLFECWEETKNPSFLVSDKTRNYAVNKLYFLIFVSLILISLMFLLIEKRSNLPFVVGSLLVVASLPFMKLDSALSFIDDKLIVGFVSVFLTKTYSVFVRLMSIGIGILTVGIILKLFLIGFRINAFVGWVKKKMKERKHSKVYPEKSLKKIFTEGKEKGNKLKSLKKSKKGEIVVEGE